MYKRILSISVAAFVLCSCGVETAGDAMKLVNKSMTMREIVGVLGHDYKDTGSGIFILEYSYSDGTKLWIGGGNMDKAPMYINQGN